MARIVSKALSEQGIDAVLTGGACASLYTRGVYQSSDLDFVVVNLARRDLDAAMRAIGFERNGNQYQHPETGFFVEFLPGPLAIGRDLDIQPVQWPRASTLSLLSATDSCRDRLAAFYFWNDRQSLRVAVQIATRHPVDLDLIRRWSMDESRPLLFGEFLAEAQQARHQKSKPGGKDRSGK